MTTVLLIQIAILILSLIIQQYEVAAEFLSRTAIRGYVYIFGSFNERLGFSLTEFSFFAVGISCIIYLAWGFNLLRNKNPWGLIHRVMMIVLISMGTVCAYHLTAGIEYHRQAAPIEMYDGEIKKEDFMQIATYFVEDYNYCAEKLGFTEEGELKLPYSKNHLIEQIRLEFDKLNDKYYHSYVPKAKGLATSGLFNTVGIVGMHFTVLGESNYNTYSTNAELPFYIAHETAHGVGVMREDEAQLLALSICANSDDPVLRYSAYYNTIDRILNILSYSDNKEDYQTVKNMISSDIWKNYNYIYNHWKGKMFLYDLGNQINDWYLKTFGQKEGTTSYNDTEPSTDPSGVVISLSQYQKIYFKIYYDHKS